VTSTTTILGPDLVKELIPQILQEFDEATKQAYLMMWNILLTFLGQHSVAVIVGLVLILVVAFLRALTGRWGMLGSVLYNYLYFGTLFIIGLIWGPEVFANDYFKLVLVILYIICFLLVGWILHKTGLRKR
jgi:hypothetical protein